MVLGETMDRLHVCHFKHHAGTGESICFGTLFTQLNLQMLSLEGDLTVLNLRQTLTLMTFVVWLSSDLMDIQSLQKFEIVFLM